jgi:hypothetical protein
MITPKSFVDGTNLTDSAATYYTTPAATKAIVKRATFCNDNSIVVTVTINLVPSGGSAAYGNRITKTRALAAGETWSCPDVENHVLEAGGFISMVASVTAKIGVRISGYELV